MYIFYLIWETSSVKVTVQFILSPRHYSITVCQKSTVYTLLIWPHLYSSLFYGSPMHSLTTGCLHSCIKKFCPLNKYMATSFWSDEPLLNSAYGVTTKPHWTIWHWLIVKAHNTWPHTHTDGTQLLFKMHKIFHNTLFLQDRALALGSAPILGWSNKPPIIQPDWRREVLCVF